MSLTTPQFAHPQGGHVATGADDMDVDEGVLGGNGADVLVEDDLRETASCPCLVMVGRLLHRPPWILMEPLLTFSLYPLCLSSIRIEGK